MFTESGLPVDHYVVDDPTPEETLVSTIYNLKVICSHPMIFFCMIRWSFGEYFMVYIYIYIYNQLLLNQRILIMKLSLRLLMFVKTYLR